MPDGATGGQDGGATLPTRARRIALALAWLAAILAIALGAAGLVAAVGAPPGTGRAELTSVGDAAIEPGLAAAQADLRALRDHVTALGQDTRTAIAALVATDRELLLSSIDSGSARIPTIDSLATAIRRDLRALPGIVGSLADPLPPSTELSLGPTSRARWRAIDDGVGAAGGLSVAWARFTTGSLAAERLTTLLLDHDAATAEAAKLGGAGRYADALTQLDTSDGITAEARTLRDKLAAGADTSTLTQWIDRNATYDTALRDLYAALEASRGRVTDAVRKAFATEQAAREALPTDTRALVVILADVARGGLNEIAIAIEAAGGRLDEAVAAADAAASETTADGLASPSTNPTP
jgi:hypothetical protein